MTDSEPNTRPPLDGVRVVDFTWIVAGPTCTRLLGDLGAEVIRVENEQTLDSIRFGRPHPNGFDPPDSGAMFNWLDRNKRSITV
ncbi:MAG: CoA transferase, partial [Chloroflexi bacterium]|nr:CoA transferase [Chloroflexota bacterium]